MLDMELFATSKNGKEITWDSVNSHAMTHFADAPGLKEIVKRIIEARKIANGRLISLDIDMGKPVGESGLVKTNENDELIYAIRKNRNTYAVFAKNRKPEPCNFVHVEITTKKDGSQYLFSAWIGPDTPPLPGSKFATSKSRDFWLKHALIWGQQEIIPGTETTKCPW